MLKIAADLFEVELDTSMDWGNVEKYYEDLYLGLGIIDDLNLNTRLWSKE